MPPDPRRSRLLQDLRKEKSDLPDPLPARIGKYAILEELGRTGTSIVFLGFHPELARKVALKVLREEMSLPEVVGRFQREATIAASLRHPHIVSVHDVGLWDEAGRRALPYIVMDYLEGGTLSGKKTGPGEAAELVATVADAIHHAHEAGIVHRDLKPGNVLLDSKGRPVVTDFGLAKSLDAAETHTREGMLLGTPQYMAPEQIRGDLNKIDARTDVYALGAILYELLSGSPPFRSPNAPELFRKILTDEPPTLAKIPGGVPISLRTIVQKALEKDPARRYATSEALGRDLRRFLAGDPILARPVSLLRRVCRLAVKHRSALLAAAGAVTLALAGLVLARAHERTARIRQCLADGERWEKSGDLWKARDAFRSVLDLEENQEARAGFLRAETELQRQRATTAAPASRWTELGGSGSARGISQTPGASIEASLALDPLGRPVVAWHEMVSGIDSYDEIRLRRWDGARWMELQGSGHEGGISGATGRPSASPSMSVDSKGNPTVAWCGASGGSSIRVRQWNGIDWSELGESGRGQGLNDAGYPAAFPSLRLDAQGRPVVAWQSGIPDYFRIYLKRWNGREWIELAGSAHGDGLSGSERDSLRPHLALDSKGNAVVAWASHARGLWNVYLKRWNGSLWEGVGGSGDPGGLTRNGVSADCSLVLDRADRPWVSWQQKVENRLQIYVKHWDGTDWVELGGSATRGGVSDAPGDSMSSCLALDPSGHPVVAWHFETTPGNSRVYLKRWDGQAWVELDGSAHEGGLTRNVGSSPSLALDPAGHPVVAWAEKDSLQVEKEKIFLRRWSPAGTPQNR